MNMTMFKITEVEWMGDRGVMLAVQTRLAVETKIKVLASDSVNLQFNFEKMQGLGQLIGEKADIMLYPTKQTLTEANQIFDDMTDAIAILSFVKGGITMFGVHYEATIDGSL
jgi:hypothetical protein